MVSIRQSFFSITAATVFGIFGLLYGVDAVNGRTISIGGFDLNPSATWALTGLLFLMAYFALVHMKHHHR